MKTLLLLRHAKSSWKDPGLADHDRPLNKRGTRDAPRMGQLVEEHGIVPDLIVTSTALRARSTAQAVADNCSYQESIQEVSDLYHAQPNAYIETFSLLPETVSRVLAVGHNPGISQLLWVLTGVGEAFPTAALAHVELPIDTWSDLVETTRGQLVEFWRPREL